MKYLLGLAAVIWALAASITNAAQLSVTPYPNNVYAVYFDGESTVFNGLGFSATPNGGAQFANVSGSFPGTPRPPGHNFTYRNRLLDTPSDDPDIPGGKGWTLLGIINYAGEIAFSGGPLGQTISTASEPNGDLFLANLKLPSSTASATVQVTLVNGVDTVFEQSIIVGVPEPTAIALAVPAALGMVAAGRRRNG